MLSKQHFLWPSEARGAVRRLTSQNRENTRSKHLQLRQMHPSLGGERESETPLSILRCAHIAPRAFGQFCFAVTSCCRLSARPAVWLYELEQQQ
jgi:hypothetical protein